MLISFDIIFVLFMNNIVLFNMIIVNRAILCTFRSTPTKEIRPKFPTELIVRSKSSAIRLNLVILIKFKRKLLIYSK